MALRKNLVKKSVYDGTIQRPKVDTRLNPYRANKTSKKGKIFKK